MREEMVRWPPPAGSRQGAKVGARPAAAGWPWSDGTGGALRVHPAARKDQCKPGKLVPAVPSLPVPLRRRRASTGLSTRRRWPATTWLCRSRTGAPCGWTPTWPTQVRRARGARGGAAPPWRAGGAGAGVVFSAARGRPRAASLWWGRLVASCACPPTHPCSLPPSSRAEGLVAMDEDEGEDEVGGKKSKARKRARSGYLLDDFASVGAAPDETGGCSANGDGWAAAWLAGACLSAPARRARASKREQATDNRCCAAPAPVPTARHAHATCPLPRPLLPPPPPPQSLRPRAGPRAPAVSSSRTRTCSASGGASATSEHARHALALPPAAGRCRGWALPVGLHVDCSAADRAGMAGKRGTSPAPPDPCHNTTHSICSL